jgi:hypothetical protein
MQVAFVPPNRTVTCGSVTGKFLRMSGSDALVELKDGRRVMWSAATDVTMLEDREEIEENVLPRLEAELARLESFTRGKYAQLGVPVETPCVELPKALHAVFVAAALGQRPPDAVVCRRCVTKLCVSAGHLFWGTRSDCQRNMLLQGLSRPSGKPVTAIVIAEKMIRLRLRVTRLRARAKC